MKENKLRFSTRLVPKNCLSPGHVPPLGAADDDVDDDDYDLNGVDGLTN